MSKRTVYIITCVLFSFITVIKAQEKDTLSRNDPWDWEWEWEWEKGKPFIELTYGLGQPKHDKLVSNLAKVGITEIKLGYVSNNSSFEDNIIQFNERYTFVSKIPTSLHSGKAKYNELSSEMWRFGFGRRTGYGYDFKSIKILPYYQTAVLWSQLKMKDYPVAIFPFVNIKNVVDDTEIIKRFDGAFRFSTLTEGGIRLELGSVLSFNAGYEAVIIFPRYLFWKHMGSLAIEMASQNALNHFIDEVLDSSPAAVPIVNFFLKNGLSYAFYTLKKSKMNWPFDSETPLTYEMFKFGFTFTF